MINPIRFNDFLGDEPGGPVKKVGLVTGREYTMAAPTSVGSTLKFAGQYVGAVLNETIAAINQNINPLYAARNGIQSLSTGRDLQTGRPMSEVDASISILSSIPIGKAFQMLGKLGGVEGMVTREVAQESANSVAKEGTKVFKHNFEYTDRVRMRAVGDPVRHNFSI